jgi:hypothetical protein
VLLTHRKFYVPKFCCGPILICSSASGPNTIDAYAAGSKNASENVAPSSKASENPGFGMLMNGTSMNTNTTGAAMSSAHVNVVALTGLVGMATYMLM